MSFLSLDIISIVSDFLESGFVKFLMNFLSIIPKLAYFIIACMLSLIDLFQVLFRKLAGMDPIVVSGEVVTGDTATNIILDAIFSSKYPAISTVFWSLTILGVFMLIITSIVATLRLEYTPDKDTKNNSKKSIIIGFFKGLFTFAIVPVTCFFGMWFTNILIQTVDTITTTQSSRVDDSMSYYDKWVGVSGTSSDIVLTNERSSYVSYDVFGITIPTSAQPFSGLMFKASAYSANRLRLEGNGLLEAYNNSDFSIGIFDGRISDAEVAADIIDTGFAINAKMKNGGGTIEYTGEIKDYFWNGLNLGFGHLDNVTHFSKYNVELVWYFYDLWQFNWIVGFVAVIMIGKMYFKFCLALMARLFEVAGLFLVSPVPIGMMPLDGGGAFGRWRGHFVAKVGLLLVMVFGINIVSPIITLIQDIKVFNVPLLDNIVLAMFLVAALNAVEAINNTVSVILFNKDFDSYSKAMSAAETAKGHLQSGLNATKSALSLGAKPVMAAGRAAGTLAVAGGSYVAKNSPRWAYAARQNASARAERREVNKATKFNSKEANANFESMKKKDRAAVAEEFYKTAAGQKFLDEHVKKYGGTVAKAKNDLLDDQRTIKRKDGSIEHQATIDNEHREAFQKFMHDKEWFNQTAEGKNLTEGSADYYAAFDKYQAGSKDDRLKSLMTIDAPLTDRQRDIIAKRRANHLDETFERHQRRKHLEKFAKHDARIKKMESTRGGRFVLGAGHLVSKAGAGVANYLGSDKTKDNVKKTRDQAYGLMGIVPGSEFFRKPK